MQRRMDMNSGQCPRTSPKQPLIDDLLSPTDCANLYFDTVGYRRRLFMAEQMKKPTGDARR